MTPHDTISWPGNDPFSPGIQAPSYPQTNPQPYTEPGTKPKVKPKYNPNDPKPANPFSAPYGAYIC